MIGYCYDCEAADRDPIVKGPTPRELLPQPRCPVCKKLGSQKKLPEVPPTHACAAQGSSAPPAPFALPAVGVQGSSAPPAPFALPAVGAIMPVPKGLF